MTQLARSTRQLRDEALKKDPQFRQYWARTALARAVANQVINYRIEHGLTQTALARILGMSQPAVARLEAGEHTPTWETLGVLAGRLGLAFTVTVFPSGMGETAEVAQALRETLPFKRGTVEQVTSPTTSSESVIAASQATTKTEALLT